MLEHHVGGDEVEGAVGEGQPADVAAYAMTDGAVLAERELVGIHAHQQLRTGQRRELLLRFESPGGQQVMTATDIQPSEVAAGDSAIQHRLVILLRVIEPRRDAACSFQ